MDIRTVHVFVGKLRTDLGVTINYEDVLERQYRAFLEPDATVIDIGAHLGRHTRCFVEACPNGRVLAVEPLPHQAAHLRQSLGASIELLEGAIGAQAGRTTFIWAQGTPEESGLKQRSYNDPARAAPTEITVDVTTLDAFGAGLERCDFIKIDVEGAELTALRSGRDLLRRLRPVLSVEYGRPAYSVYGHEAHELFDFAIENNYRVLDLFMNPIAGRDEWLAVVDEATWDFFLVPSEKMPLRLDYSRATPRGGTPAALEEPSGTDRGLEGRTERLRSSFDPRSLIKRLLRR